MLVTELQDEAKRFFADAQNDISHTLSRSYVILSEAKLARRTAVDLFCFLALFHSQHEDQ